MFHHVKWQNQFQHGQKPAGEGQGQKRFFQGWAACSRFTAEEPTNGIMPKFSALFLPNKMVKPVVSAITMVYGTFKYSYSGL